MGTCLWEIIHIFLVVRFYFCLPIQNGSVELQEDTTLYGSHGRFSPSLPLLVYLRIDEIPFTGLSREREPREENRGEERRGKKGRAGKREGRRREDEMRWL